MSDPKKLKLDHFNGKPLARLELPKAKAIIEKRILAEILKIVITINDFLVIIFPCTLTLSQKFHRGNG